MLKLTVVTTKTSLGRGLPKKSEEWFQVREKWDTAPTLRAKPESSSCLLIPDFGSFAAFLLPTRNPKLQNSLPPLHIPVVFRPVFSAVYVFVLLLRMKGKDLKLKFRI